MKASTINTIKKYVRMFFSNLEEITWLLIVVAACLIFPPMILVLIGIALVCGTIYFGERLYQWSKTPTKEDE